MFVIVVKKNVIFTSITFTRTSVCIVTLYVQYLFYRRVLKSSLALRDGLERL